MYVADPGLHQVRKLSPNGQELAAWKSCDYVGQPGWMVAPVSIAIDGTSNNIYVLDQSVDTVTRYSPDGKIQKHGKGMLQSLVAVVDQSPELFDKVQSFWRERLDAGAGPSFTRN